MDESKFLPKIKRLKTRAVIFCKVFQLKMLFVQDCRQLSLFISTNSGTFKHKNKSFLLPFFLFLVISKHLFEMSRLADDYIISREKKRGVFLS